VPERERAADCKLRRRTGEGKVAVEMPEICLGSDSSTDPAAPGMLNTEEIRRRAMKANQNEAESSPSAKDLVVFEILRDSKCTGCGQVIRKGEFLFLDGERALCLSCADFDHLEYLLRGDAALTRRAKKYSGLSAVVVRFSRSRGRYERQGILAEVSALERAEEECQADAQQRAARCRRDDMRRREQDRELVARMTQAVRELFPGCPPEEARAIAAHTAARGSGRVGRTSAGRTLEPEALTAAVVAAIRHNHTRYDQLLMRGWSRIDARDAVRDVIDRIIESLRSPLGR
jgi:hypothetical protein